MLELLVGLFILVMGSLTVFSISTLSARIGREGEARGVAMSIARMKLDELYRLSQSNRHDVQDRPFTIPDSILNEFPGGTSQVHAWGHYSIATSPGSANLQQLTAVIEWQLLSASGNWSQKQSVVLSKQVSTLEWVAGNPGNFDDPNIDNYFYTPPPPPPPPAGTGGSTGGNSTGSSTDGSTTTGSSSSGATTSTGSTTDGSTTGGGSSSSSGGTTGSPWESPGYGYKW